MSQTFTTKEAAERLGITAARVRQLVLAGQLPAEKFGRDLVIHESDLESVKDRPIGRPRGKPSTAKKAATKAASASNRRSPARASKKKGGKK
jgi:excisionase family DNA binding protein